MTINDNHDSFSLSNIFEYLLFVLTFTTLHSRCASPETLVFTTFQHL